MSCSSACWRCLGIGCALLMLGLGLLAGFTMLAGLYWLAGLIAAGALGAIDLAARCFERAPLSPSS